MEIAAPGVVRVADGGGHVTVVRTPIHRDELLAKLLAGANRYVAVDMATGWLNRRLRAGSSSTASRAPR